MVKSKQASQGEGIKLKCKRCGHEWTYKGKRKFYVQCPDCRTSINIQPFLAEAEAK